MNSLKKARLSNGTILHSRCWKLRDEWLGRFRLINDNMFIVYLIFHIKTILNDSFPKKNVCLLINVHSGNALIEMHRSYLSLQIYLYKTGSLWSVIVIHSMYDLLVSVFN